MIDLNRHAIEHIKASAHDMGVSSDLIFFLSFLVIVSVPFLLIWFANWIGRRP